MGMDFKSALKPGVKAEWLSVLKANKDKRAEGVLSDGCGSMCCLGWLMTVTGDLEPGGEPANELVWGDGDEELPAYHVLKKAGLTYEDANKLAKINDDEGRFPIREIMWLRSEKQ